MIETIMYIGIGFLAAALFGLLFVPLLHNRAVRLTTRRLDAATPLSIIEVRADKDKLRAQFAMSIRRLEMSVAEMKTKAAGYLVEISKKTATVNQLKKEFGEKTATISALEARDKTLRDQLRATEERLQVKSRLLREAERPRSNKEAELIKQVAAASSLLAEREFEIKRLHEELDAAGAIEDDLRSELAAARGRNRSVANKLHSEIDRLEVQLYSVVEARSKQ